MTSIDDHENVFIIVFYSNRQSVDSYDYKTILIITTCHDKKNTRYDVEQLPLKPDYF